MQATTWLVQTNVTPESPTPAALQRACGNERRVYLPFTVLPGSKTLPTIPDVAKGGPVVFHGRSSLILSALASPWKHGVFFDPGKFNHQAYAEGFGDLLLNWSATVMTWADPMALAKRSTGYRFIKPNNDFKGFTGQALSLAAVDPLFQSLSAKHGQDLMTTEVVVAEAHEVDAEWRLFIVNGDIVTGSMYRPAGGRHVPDDVMAFGRTAAKTWTPSAVFSLDIGKVGDQYRVVECNCFNASRLYDSDVDLIVNAVSSYQEARYESLPREELLGMA